MSRSLRRLTAVTAATVALVVVGASSAAAHVGVHAEDPVAGSYTVLRFDVPHGCGDAGTTGLSIEIPPEIESVAPTVAPGWDIELIHTELAEPRDDGHGGWQRERVSEVQFRAEEPLPAHMRAVFELSVRIADDAAGEMLAFPSIQTCEEGETAWIQVPGEGQDPEQLESPAPMLSVSSAAADDGSEPTPTLSYVALGAAIAALVLAGIALFRGRRSRE